MPGKLSAQENIYKNTLIYSQKQGLSSPNIHKILKDKNGFVWIATQDGLNRFEGKEFVVYNKGSVHKRALFSSDIRDLIYDSLQNILFVICNQGGINGIDINTGEVIYRIAYIDSLGDKWRICARQYRDKIYIGTSGGLEIFNIKRQVFEKGENRTLRSLKKNGINDIRVIDIDSNGNLWLGVMNRGLVILDPLTGTILNEIFSTGTENNSASISFWPLCGTFFSDSLYLIATKNGLQAFKWSGDYKLTQQKLYNKLKQFAGQEVNHILLNNKGDLIIGANNLFRFNTVNNDLYQVIPDKIDAAPWLKNITYCFEDEKNNLWLGCRQGVVLIKNSAPFLFGRETNKMSDNGLGHIYATLKISDSEILLGSQKGLYKIRNDSIAEQLTGSGLVQNIFRLNSSDIIISASNRTSLYSENKIIPVSNRYPEFAKYQNWQFNSATVLNDSIIVVGSESNQGVLLWNKKRKSIRLLEEKANNKVFKINSNTVNTVFRQRNNKVAILSDYTISILENEGITPQHVSIKGTAAKREFGIYMDMAETGDSYWLAAYGEGLLQLDKNYRLKKIFEIKDGLSNNGVYKLFNYKDSILILTTNNGISVFTVKNNTFKNFYEKDGLQNDAFEEACGDTFKNKFYAGGVNGYTIIDPSKLIINFSPPQIYINRALIETDNEKTDTSGLSIRKLIIPDNVLQTTLYFSGINWSNPERTTFAWRIKERSKEWSNIGIQNFLNLIGLEHGIYHFEVKAANEDGIWSEPKELILIFLPKWYQTWWFKLLVFTITAGIIYAFYRYRIGQIKKQHEIRKNIATDLHDDLGSTLNSVKVFTNLAISGVKQEESLQQVKDNLTEATMSLRDMIWVLDDSLDTVDELVTRIKQFAIPVANASNIQTVIKAASEVNSRQLTKEEKRNLFLISKEAINNSIKYSGATQIEVAINPHGKKIAIVIADNGKGFNVNEVKKGYGLKNMQYRAGQVKFKATLHSSPGSGTSISIVPA